MAITKTSNLIIPEVFANIALGEFEQASKLLPFAKVYNNLQGNPGGIIHFPKWETLSDADELTEGTPLTTEVLSQTDTSATVKEVGKGVEITDKAILEGLGDPIGEGARQIGITCANKVDKDLFAEYNTTTNVLDASSSVLTYEAIVDGLAMFGEQLTDAQALFVHSKQFQALMKDSNFIDASKFGAPIMINGFRALGMIAGVPVVISDRVNKTLVDPDGNPNSGDEYYTYDAILFRPNAVGLAYKRKMNTEQDRDILARSTIVVGTLYYAVKLVYANKVVKITSK